MNMDYLKKNKNFCWNLLLNLEVIIKKIINLIDLIICLILYGIQNLF